MFDLRSIVAGIILMLKKYTCINITIYANTTDEDYKRGILVLPLIGFVIGFVAFFIAGLKFFYDSFFIGVLILIYFNIITKSVNIKDTYTSLNYLLKTKDNNDQITGMVGIILINLLYFSLIGIIPSTGLIIMPVAGYSNLILLSFIIKSNKDDTSVMKYCEKYHIISAFVISFLLTVIFNYRLIISLSLTYMITGIVISLLDERIGKITDSFEGFIIEITQALFLIITYMMYL
ncbi:hypothetical protein [Sedimentibacter sp.]|uniref:hypothetical protein n=1 Tax=Sedimentibacter sp. TaxID=1960295 RepID=UPI0028AB3A30|nr:hypothetical protein [Sedimentibacter sp.]